MLISSRNPSKKDKSCTRHPESHHWPNCDGKWVFAASPAWPVQFLWRMAGSVPELLQGRSYPGDQKLGLCRPALMTRHSWAMSPFRQSKNYFNWDIQSVQHSLSALCQILSPNYGECGHYNTRPPDTERYQTQVNLEEECIFWMWDKLNSPILPGPGSSDLQTLIQKESELTTQLNMI